MVLYWCTLSQLTLTTQSGSIYACLLTSRQEEDEDEEEEEGGDSGKADEVTHPHEHVSIITVFWFPGTARPPGDAAVGHICCVLRRRVVQHSCVATHNQSDSGSGGPNVCMHKCGSFFLSALVRNRHIC